MGFSGADMRPCARGVSVWVCGPGPPLACCCRGRRVASVFALAGQLDVWARGTVEGPRPENAFLLSLVAWPLVARRRWPNAVLVTIAAGIALQALVSPDGRLPAFCSRGR